MVFRRNIERNQGVRPIKNDPINSPTALQGATKQWAQLFNGALPQRPPDSPQAPRVVGFDARRTQDVFGHAAAAARTAIEDDGLFLFQERRGFIADAVQRNVERAFEVVGFEFFRRAYINDDGALFAQGFVVGFGAEAQ